MSGKPLVVSHRTLSSHTVAGDRRFSLGGARRPVPTDDSRPSDRRADTGVAPARKRAAQGTVHFPPDELLPISARFDFSIGPFYNRHLKNYSHNIFSPSICPVPNT